MSRLVTYSSRQVQIVWGTMPFVGFSDEGIVSIEFNSDRTSEKIGASGEASVSITPDRSGTITVQFAQGSPTHIALCKIMQQEEINAELFVADMRISAPDGVTYKPTGCHIKTAPPVGKGTETETYSYTFFSDAIEFAELPVGLGPIDALESTINAQVQSLRNISQAKLNFLN